MHEFSLCTAIINEARRANLDDLLAVNEVLVEVGKLASVDIEALAFWFPVVATKMNAAHLKLTIIQINGLAECNICQQQFVLNDFYQACPKCATYAEYRVIGGQELLLKALYLKQNCVELQNSNLK